MASFEVELKSLKDDLASAENEKFAFNRFDGFDIRKDNKG